MQHIGLSLENEQGVVLKNSDLNLAPLVAELFDQIGYKDRFPLLSGIDPYGDTVFNVHQVQALLGELKKLKSDTPKENIRNLICDLGEFLEKAEQHDYVRFMGD